LGQVDGSRRWNIREYHPRWQRGLAGANTVHTISRNSQRKEGNNGITDHYLLGVTGADFGWNIRWFRLVMVSALQRTGHFGAVHHHWAKDTKAVMVNALQAHKAREETRQISEPKWTDLHSAASKSLLRDGWVEAACSS